MFKVNYSLENGEERAVLTTRNEDDKGTGVLWKLRVRMQSVVVEERCLWNEEKIRRADGRRGATFASAYQNETNDKARNGGWKDCLARRNVYLSLVTFWRQPLFLCVCSVARKKRNKRQEPRRKEPRWRSLAEGNGFGGLSGWREE